MYHYSHPDVLYLYCTFIYPLLIHIHVLVLFLYTRVRHLSIYRVSFLYTQLDTLLFIEAFDAINTRESPLTIQRWLDDPWSEL